MKTCSLILGGTKGLGRALAIESLRRYIRPIVVGRSAEKLYEDPALHGAELFAADLTDIETAYRGISRGLFDSEWTPKDLKPQSIAFVVWVAGVFLRKPIVEHSEKDIRQMINTHLTGPVSVLSALSETMKLSHAAYHLITIASTSSWRVRENEALYCALKAAKAHFTRNFVGELVRDLPGSKATLVNPGGLKTPNFWENSGQDISKFMEPDEVARIIWNTVLAQEKPFVEMQIMRNDDGTPNVSYWPHLPEQPF